MTEQSPFRDEGSSVSDSSRKLRAEEESVSLDRARPSGDELGRLCVESAAAVAPWIDILLSFFRYIASGGPSSATRSCGVVSLSVIQNGGDDLRMSSSLPAPC